METEQTFALRTEYITLGQLLKAAGIVGGGGEARALLAEGGVRVNGEEDNRRGRKLRIGDIVVLPVGITIRIQAT